MQAWQKKLAEQGTKVRHVAIFMREDMQVMPVNDILPPCPLDRIQTASSLMTLELTLPPSASSSMPYVVPILSLSS